MDLVAAATFGTSDSNLETTGLLLPCCGKAVDHTNTRVWHDGHIGYLCDGKMYCSVQEEEPLMQHQLSSTSPCKLIPRLDSHIHGPDCGHEVVLHDDHYDYLVGEELHHVVDDTCCSRGCIQGIQEQALVRHGTLSVLRHRQLSNTPAKAAAACRRREPEISILTEGPAESEAVVISKIYAAGICCPSEVPLISNLLSPLPGVHKVEVAVMTKTVTVTHKASFISSAALVAALNGARLDASMQAPRRQGSSKGHWIPPWNVLLSAGLLCISLIHYAKGPGSRAWLEQLKWVALASVAIGIPPILLKALAALRNKVLDINMLMTLAVIGAIAIGDYTEAAAVVVLFALAEFFEDRCGERARNAIAEVIALSPATAILAETGEQVSVDQLKIGDLVSVKPGEQVPVDGTVSTGTTRVDQSMLTGEATPVKKGPSDQVLGGTLNVGSGLLVVTATALAADSAVARVASLVEQAAGQQSPTETLVARFAKWYTPTVVFACLLLIVIPAAVGAHLKDWVYLSLQVLVTACPCALVLSTPVVVVTGLARAAHEGVLIKGGRYLELLAKAKIATFDKTGTLTQGRFQVVHSEAVPGGEVNSMLQLAGCLERTSAHPVAAAIVGHAASLGLALDLDVSESEEVPGQGVIAHVAEHVVAVGNVRLMTDCCAEDVAVPPSVAEWSTKGATVCCVAVDGQLAGFVAVADTVRDEAAAAVAALRKQGVVCGMLTGDGQGAAAAIASAVGLDAKLVHSQLLPEDKLDLVEKYKREYGALIHVGDGVNDAPALAAADIGIAMGVAGSAMAIEAADVALFTNDLQCLAPIIGLARSAHRKILQNIALSVVTKVAVLVLASVGKFTLWGAVLIHQTRAGTSAFCKQEDHFN
ncbi:hypothetical protein WJX72_008845 [[Myrmecia] bisecta]|uniref:HMA domain-containing protein n=1 Tax=[Myrmecia] bisecta TaxID=41462 RepID=A0AAW1R875_9CHLO